jgi:predicted Ser/Thr protein kinase
METQAICKECGALLGLNTPEGLCPKCLLKAALGTRAGPEPAGGATASGPLPTPAQLSEYFPQLEILELLGKGGMGVVYKARQPSLDRLVALKILPVKAANDSGFAERFNREARALAKLSHPNIVAVYDFGQTSNGLHYFIMEFVDGPNLRQVEQAGKLDPRGALQVIPQICEALQFAHDEGVVHRDVKPENVLLDKKGRVKIADFGLAKILGMEAQNMRLTGAKDLMGTPAYMAPEQMEHPREVDHRADIYSLGVVFYEMLTGELPLGKFAPPSHKVHMDVRLDDVVLRTLEKEPELRYQQARQVKSDVETIATRPSPPAPDSASALGDPWRQVKGPAIGLMIVSLFNWIALPLLLLGMALVSRRNSTGVPLRLMIVPLMMLLLSAIIFLAGLKMKRLEGYWLAVIGSILSMLVAPGNLIGLPIGIWALVVLGHRDIRAAFAARKQGQIPSLPPPAVAAHHGQSWKIAAVLVAGMMFLLSIPVGLLLLSIGLPALSRARALETAPPTAAEWAPVLDATAPASGRPAANLEASTPPVVIRTVPPSGSSGVDPGLKEIQATFSKPMATGSFAWCSFGSTLANFPETNGPPAFSNDGRTCSLPVKLRPGQVYATWLNSETHHNFRDLDGHPTVPYLLIFETRK